MTEIIKLNVGGTLFNTSRSTLEILPYFQIIFKLCSKMNLKL